MEGRNILIIGGSGGIGAAAVRRFRAAGDNVVFTYHKSELDADDLRQETGAVPVRCDVRFGNSVRIAADKAYSVLGRIDVLICCAETADHAPVTDIEETRWEEVIDTNLNGVFYCIRNVLPLMIQQKSGTIITVSPVWGSVEGYCGVAYRASKAGVAGMTRALAEEVKSSGITVNCIAPDMSENPDEAASAMMYLASEDAKSVTGRVLDAKGDITG